MKFEKDTLYLPFSLRLGLVPVSLLCIYMAQVQARISFDSYQRLLYFGVAITTLCLASWDKIQTPIQFMYSCFFKRIGGHDQQSRLESFYQDQAQSKDIIKFVCTPFYFDSLTFFFF